MVTVKAMMNSQEWKMEDELLFGVFPDHFKWASATSSYQIEGAWNADGKGESIWDHFCHQDPTRIVDKNNGDRACDSYNKYKEDVKLLKNLGVSHYRFSLSWARILPDGSTGSVNEKGIHYYNNLIDELQMNGLQAMVTLYHWELPQKLQDDGGWQNDNIADQFAEFARVCFSRFGDRVKLWITINQPWVISVAGHGLGEFAPGVQCPIAVYKVGHNLLKSHAKVWHLYKKEFCQRQHGEVGIILNSPWMQSSTDNAEDQLAAERAMQFKLGWFAHSIFSKEGDYPLIMRQLIDKKSEEEGLQHSRLPVFTSEEIGYIKGTSDFFGLNHYTTYLVKNGHDEVAPTWEKDEDSIKWQDPAWPSSASSWLKSYPKGMRRILNWIKEEYNNPPVYITENGWSDLPETGVNDQERVEYYKANINEALKAYHLDGCNLRGYTVWSLLDNFEWSSGYTKRFGIHKVDFSDPNLPRTQKKSAKVYSEIVKNNGFSF